MSFEFLFFGSAFYVTANLIFYPYRGFKSIYKTNGKSFVNYTIADFLLSIFFFPYESASILTSANWLTKRPFHKPILKVGDKLNVDGKVREVLQVEINKEFDEVVKLSGYTSYQLGEWQLSKDIQQHKISALQELL